MLRGSLTALITPFSTDGVDEKALVKLVRAQLSAGTHGLVPVGTTGEAPTLSRSEQRRVIEIVVGETAGAVPVVAGAGANDPVKAAQYADDAAEAGADAVLHVCGYYNRPNQEGIYRHFEHVARHSALPILVYNVPPRTIIDVLPETMARIAKLPNVIGVKDATCDLSRPVREAALIDGDFCFLSGEDPTAVAYNAHGGRGCISVTANIAPAMCVSMQEACEQGDFATALDLQQQLMPLHEALFLEPSPAGVKYASALLHGHSDHCRLPIVPLTTGTQTAIEESMTSLGLIN